MDTVSIPPRPVVLDGAIAHPSCGKSWTGNRTAHCPKCCETFSGTYAFDAHQRLNSGLLTCLAPDKVGLVAVGKPWGVMWSWPPNDRNPWTAPQDGGSDA